jgi:hypothetical protein
MVYNPDVNRTPQRLSAILVANLTAAQLDTVQQKFGTGANLCCPYPEHALFIEDRRSLPSRSHADLKRFADEDDVRDEQAENTNTLFKIRMKIEDIVIQYANYSIANTDIREDLDTIDAPCPLPENFDQDEVFGTEFDYIEDRYLTPTWVVASPEEMDSSTDPEDLKNFSPRPSIVYRLKPEIAKQHGLMSGWTEASDTEDVDMPDRSKKMFPDGSKVLQLEYDPETAVSRYERPEGSL